VIPFQRARPGVTRPCRKGNPHVHPLRVLSGPCEARHAEATFDAHVKAELCALWSRIPHAREVRVLREVESDRPEQHLELVNAVQFDSRDDIAAALDSDIRRAGRAASQPLFGMFDGDVFRTVLAADQLPLPCGEVVARP